MKPAKRNILLIGAAGTGKTWVMKQLLASMNTWDVKRGLIDAKYDDEKKVAILGKYDGSMFEGSDRLSMAVARDFESLHELFSSLGAIIIAEGDRFMNAKYISIFDPLIIKIIGDGSEGIAKRGSNQSARHLKAIQTRVANIKANVASSSSSAAFAYIEDLLCAE